MPPLITIAVQCHNFQRRLCWMLSSLAQQTAPNLVVIDIAHLPSNGQPTTEAVIERFSDRLNIRSSPWTDFDQFQFRGIVRNRQLRNCLTHWILFSDSDM